MLRPLFCRYCPAPHSFCSRLSTFRGVTKRSKRVRHLGGGGGTESRESEGPEATADQRKKGWRWCHVCSHSHCQAGERSLVNVHYVKAGRRAGSCYVVFPCEWKIEESP